MGVKDIRVKDFYIVTGFFYEIADYKFRKYLNIKDKCSVIENPDLMVVMMNPGSSKPISDKESNNIEIETKPDTTQVQIMKIMQRFKYKYARILNLSDLREPKSHVFYKKIIELDKKQIYHSIFSENRIKDFQELFEKRVDVIYAWGVNKKLAELSKIAWNCIGIDNPIGLKKENQAYSFYHPLPRNNEEQKEWIRKIIKMIEKAHNPA